LGIFNRSQYEDVLIVRVHDLAPWQGRHEEIARFEADAGVTWVKCMLHISSDEQRERLLARLDDPRKRWKFNEGDLAERARWDDYAVAYQDALECCDSDAAPWYVVPADRKWYRNWAVQQLLLETLRELDPRYPERADLDLPALKRALSRTS
jgi:polyphosphate kinase 2 (PPK2 family)